MKINQKKRGLFFIGKRFLIYFMAAGYFFLVCGCQKYLDAKPDKALAAPSSIGDLQALLDNNALNTSYPDSGDIACDDYFVGYNDWLSFSVNARNTYIWDAGAVNNFDWQYGYHNILVANVVLDNIDQVPSGSAAPGSVKGAALFFRGYNLYQLANVYTAPYNRSVSGQDLGIPLELKADITAKTTRSSLEATYQQIIGDLKLAALLLPDVPTVKTRPSRPAAFGALARVYLAMQDYANANLYADSCLGIYHSLINYNTLDTASLNPFSLFNDEVIFHASSIAYDDVVDPYYARVDTILYGTYSGNDLRKYLFYVYAENGHYAFKGDYVGQSYGSLFNGIATDEVLLTRAETFVRLGNVSAGIKDLNSLLATRFAAGTYVPYSSEMAADDALALILKERRKELAFRGELRWADLRRLNQDPRFAVTLRRNLNGKGYTLLPNDKRYAFILPPTVIQMSGIPQNPR
ncbi:RagB/SusD family nutrient uptake outer membrane protein [Mucilaginibacter sp. McL0603]|uniref:RagB/SusD family nutrient uptake outer membrane protein n=1 Tax=Mucilaginibacter sp. McL0603 TaxID=3415670 RepID=UPI003CE7CC18